MLEQRYTDKQLSKIIEQSLFYSCACPAQICAELNSLRKLYEYQAKCLNATETDRLVHERIALSVERMHADMENCLTEVLALEGWNSETLEMPENLQKRMLKDAQGDT